jgi:hypothetical protein
VATPSDALIARIGVDTAALRNDLAQAKAQFEGFGGTVKGALGAIAGTLAATFSVAAFSAWIKGAIDAADETNKLAQKVGLTVREVGGLQLAFRQAGLDTGQFEAAMGRLAKSASEGNIAFAAIGVNVRAADGTLKSTRQLLGETADQFAGMEDSAAKTALAMELFGKAGAALIPVLNLGAAGLAEFDAMAEQLGLTLDETTARNAERFNDTLDLIGQAGQGVARQLMAELLPTLNSVAAGMFDAVTKGDTLRKVAEALGVAFKGLYTIAAGLVTAFKTVGTALGGVGAAIAAVLRGDFGQVKRIIADMAGDIRESWAGAARNVRDVWSGANADTVAGLAAVTGAAKRAAPVLADVASASKKAAESNKAYVQYVDTIYKRALAEAQAEQKAYEEAIRKTAEAQEKALAVLRNSAASVEEQVAALRDEAAAATLAAASNVSLAEAVQLVAIARLGEQAAALQAEGTSEGAVAIVEREIAARRELIRELNNKSGREAATESARTAADAWRSAATDIERALTDALVRGFESGKSVVRSIGDYIVNYFKTTIARGIAQAITGSITGLLGGVAQAATGGAAGSAVSGAGLLGSLFGGTGSFASGLLSLQTPAAAFNQFLLGGSGAQLFGAVMPYVAAAYGAYALISGAGTGRQRAPAYQQFGIVGDLGFGYAAGSPNLALGGAGYYTPIIQPIADAVAMAVTRLGGTLGNTSYGLYTSTGSEGSGAYLRADVNSRLIAESNAANETLEARIKEALPKLLLAGLQDSNLDAVFADYFSKLDLSTATAETVNAAIEAATAAKTLADALVGLGGNLAALPQLTVEARNELIGMFGGIGNVLQSVSAYQANYLTDLEREGLLRQQLSATLADVGLALPTTREAFRALVESQDLTTESGRKAWAVLMQVNGAFADLVPATEGAAAATEELVTASRSAADIARERAGLERQLLTLQGDTAALRALDLAELDESNRALQERIWAIEDERAAVDEFNRTLASFSIDGDALARTLRDGLVGKISGEELGAALGEQVAGGIEAAMADTYSKQIADVFVTSIITPMMQSIIAGGTVAEALATGQINTAIERAKEIGKAFVAVFNDPAFRAAMDELRESFADLGTAIGTTATAATSAASQGQMGQPIWAGGPPTVDYLPQWYLDEQAAANLARNGPFGQAAGDDTTAVDREAARIAAERYQIETQLLQLQGDTAELRRRELATLDESNRALMESVYARQDEIAAAEEAARAAAEAAAQTARVAGERYQIETQLLQLNGDTAALRARELAALDESNRALMQAVYARQDEIAAAEALARAATEAAAQAQRVAGEREGLERRLLQLQGNTAELRARELAALDPTNRALLQMIWALEDAAVVIDDVGRSAADIARERYDLETQLLQLQGDTTALRARELERIDESNRALQERIWALQDEIAAQRAAEQAAREAEAAAREAAAALERAAQEQAAALQRVADERYGLEERLLQLQGDTAALRARELAQVDASNRALLERIFALEDERAAAEAAAQAQAAAKTIADERYGLETRLLQLQGNTTALRARELASIDESNQALLRQIWALEDARAAADEMVRSLTSMRDMLRNAADSLIGPGGGQSAAAGRSFISAALAAARATGSLPDQDDLAAAIAAATAGVNSAGYATRLEAERARLSLALDLQALADIADDQLAAVDTSTQIALDQLDTLRSIDRTMQVVFDRATQAALWIPPTGAAGEAAPGSAAAAASAADLEELRIEMRAVAAHTARTARLLERVTRDGDALMTREAAPL